MAHKSRDELIKVSAVTLRVVHGWSDVAVKNWVRAVQGENRKTNITGAAPGVPATKRIIQKWLREFEHALSRPTLSKAWEHY